MVEKRKKQEEVVLNNKRDKKDPFSKKYEEIHRLESELLQGIQFSNNLVPLLAMCEESESLEVVHASILALKRVFLNLMPQKSSRQAEDELSSKEKVEVWVRERYISYLNLMLRFISHEEPGIQLPALKCLLALLIKETELKSKVQKKYSFFNDLYMRIVQAVIMTNNLNDHLLETFIDEYLAKYDDLRYFFFKNVAKVLIRSREKTATLPFFSDSHSAHSTNASLSQHELSTMIDNVSLCLFRLKFPLSKYDTFFCAASNIPRDDYQQKEQQKVFSDCWLAFLSFPLTTQHYKQVLLLLHPLLPSFTNPCLLMDFLTSAYDQGGLLSLLSLNGLFILMTKYNLDYPAFYQKLYTLFDLSLMHSSYRARFFRMADLFLSSTHLPAYLIAAFIKRMARLALRSPPGAILVLLPMIFNLLRRHASCHSLIHGASVASSSPFSDLLADATTKNADSSLTDANKNSSSDGATVDSYDFEASDPVNANALSSSLYEFSLLKQHYCPAVSSMMKIFEHPLQPPKVALPLFQIDKLAEATYTSILETEMAVDKMVVKPATAYNVQGALFDFTQSQILTL